MNLDIVDRWLSEVNSCLRYDTRFQTFQRVELEPAPGAQRKTASEAFQSPEPRTGFDEQLEKHVFGVTITVRGRYPSLTNLLHANTYRLRAVRSFDF